MTDTLFKAPRARKSPRQDDYEPPPSSSSLVGKRPRTAEDFLLFCKFILDYENYEMQRHEELRAKAGSPIGSTGSESTKSETPSSNSGEERNKASSDSDSEDDGYNTVTCFCGKPFAGRPMIECSRCLTWIHLSCARIRRTNIPDEFICAKCRDGTTSSNNMQS